MSKRNLLFLAALGLIGFAGASCSKKEKSATTGWHYNDKKWGGFELHKTPQQETGPNLVYIPGGTYTAGLLENDLLYEGDAIPRRFTISDFYMDKTEVANKDYLEYLYWLRRVFGQDIPQVEELAKPDTLVWRDPLAYNEPFVRFYFRHPAYQNYPVVGVSWLQATEYCKWRTDRVNEGILIEKGYLNPNPEQTGSDNFNTEAYLLGQYEPSTKKKKKDLATGGERNIRLEDGILLPDYRLPFESEWEYAALALQGNAKFENINDSRIYPWDGLGMRRTEGRYVGKMRTNFKRGRGDQGGVSEMPNDAAAITAPVISYWPNDFGLYNMGGNVSEWVMDVYRPLTWQDAADFNTFRGNVFQKIEKDEDGNVVEKDSLGRIKYVDVTDEENANRRNYKKADNRGYKDEMSYMEGQQMYDYGNSSLVSDNARVYKGGSWNDRAFYNAPGARRFLDEKQALSTLGFRCAMVHVGGRKFEE